MPPPDGKAALPRATVAELEELQHETFDYFVKEANPANGLIRDKTESDWPASIAATGLALACYPAAVERGLMNREDAMRRTLKTLEFFWSSPQGPEPDSTAHRGFYYHYLDMTSGRRAWSCELSTIDSTFLLAGALAAAAYFDRATAAEDRIRVLADALYQRADWRWALNGGETLAHGWTPEGGFLPHRWRGYDESLLLYVLALGSPTFPLRAASYAAWTSTFSWISWRGYDYLYSGPLFTHQLSHVWLDLRGVQDAFMREKGLDYFENSRRATYVQQAYAIDNPGGFADYSECCWGVTASEGPGPAMLTLNGVRREFYGYRARGVPHGPDDGTLAPWAVVASLPFAPEIVLEALHHCIHQAKLTQFNAYGFKAAFNPTHPGEPGNSYGWWVSPWHFGLNQGPIVLMIENYLTGLPWRLMRSCAPVIAGLRRAGFTGGWLEEWDAGLAGPGAS